MENSFEKNVRAAARAGWWTLLIAAGFLLLQWIMYLLVLSIRPTWLPPMWGPDVGWDTVQRVWFQAIAIFKLSLWLLALIVLWLTLWARQMRRRAG